MRSRKLIAPLTLALLLLMSPGAGWTQEVEKKVTLKGHELSLPAALKFEAGTDKLAAGSEKTLRLLADFLVEKKVITMVRVEGHVARGGDRAAAQRLSERRALAVARRLASQGVDCKRLIAVGFGDTKPLEADGAANERVTFVNAAFGGRLIGGMPADGGGKAAGDACQK